MNSNCSQILCTLFHKYARDNRQVSKQELLFRVEAVCNMQVVSFPKKETLLRLRRTTSR